MISLIIFDLDGTLIGTKGHVEDCVWQAVERAQVGGIRFAVCTGRPCMGVARKIAERLGPNSPHIFQNGAHIAYPSGEAVKVFALKESSARRILELSRTRNLTLELYTPTTLFIERKTPLAETHAKMIGVTPIVRDLADVLVSEPVIRAQWIVKTEAWATLQGVAIPDIQRSVASAPPMPGSYFVSLTQKDVSKGEATQRLIAHFRLEPEQVLAVGDSESDTPMLDAVGFPVVMANAPEPLKARYQLIAGAVDDCGVVPIIERALKSDSLTAADT